METIVAILVNHQKTKTPCGYVFDCNIQSYIENFMLANHYGSHDYVLSFFKDKPKNGTWTKVKVREILNTEGDLKKVKYIVKY